MERDQATDGLPETCIDTDEIEQAIDTAFEKIKRLQNKDISERLKIAERKLDNIETDLADFLE